ncbi:hypothetical protein BCR34DRAFT_557519 [Clohesyomyces aquaticus]|uniref:Uncharacterized protein n=1 Tax=Clohesyomyces aquaticus TaxID=1231657 RepID=A0A1Y2A156_9PLEO|nr:hypothetical protein BCR34DRAFT_557519 [Clohesyomyces aquaticus]
MSCASKPSEQPERDSPGLNTTTITSRLHDTGEAQDAKAGPPSTRYSTKRSEVLRHVFPRPRGPHPAQPTSSPRVTKPHHRRGTLSSIRQSKSRLLCNRVLTSLFHNNPTSIEPSSMRQRIPSNLSSIRSKLGSGHDSVPNLEVLSPGTFLFSGPSLRSTRSWSISNPTSRLPSLAETGSEAISLRRTHSESFSADGVSFLDESILEPLAEDGITRSMSDVLLGIHTPTEEMEQLIIEDSDKDSPQLTEHQQRISSSNDLLFDASLLATLASYLGPSSRNAMRLTCRSWHSALSGPAPSNSMPVCSGPTEILQHIYIYLSPKDFNAARHTCGAWMRASLDKKLLTIMHKRGGWWSSADVDLDRRNGTPTFSKTTSDEWFLSRRLSRECSLYSRWTGNGLNSLGNDAAIVEVAATEFTDLANGYPGPEGRLSSGLIFTTSVCGRLLLVARETLIFVYELQGSILRPVTSVGCPRRVLSMSMDMTSGRNAIAGLLEGRMGMVCELQFEWSHSDTFSDSHSQRQDSLRPKSMPSIQESDYSDSGPSMAPADRPTSHLSERKVDNRQQTLFNSIHVKSNHESISLQSANDPDTYGQSWINHTWNIKLGGAPTVQESCIHANPVFGCGRAIPVETGTSTFYRHLCSEDDPPRSVAICPQRRCVAFGCSAGIELHWVDALTGQSLSRWFPLTAPSDYLYFLPPRPGFESAKKLRLISSAAHPDDRPAIRRKFFTGRPTLSSFWGSFGFEPPGSRASASSCDHYRAVPLSDGHHILFTDPPTGRLFLGCDAPLGGPTKLLRKIKFIPPEENQVPRLYTAAADLSWGARVVVAFDDDIVVYSVPPDVLMLSKLEQKADSWDVYTSPPFSTEGHAKDHWLDWWDEPHIPEHSPIWPLALRGTHLGSLRSVCELSVFTNPDITIWAFSFAQSTTWQLRGTAEPLERSRRYICQTGIVHESYSVDRDGDIVMADHYESSSRTSSSPEIVHGGVAEFDGHGSQVLVKRLPKALHIDNDEWVELIDAGSGGWYDTDGDVIIFGMDAEDRLGWQDEDEDY